MTATAPADTKHRVTEARPLRNDARITAVIASECTAGHVARFDGQCASLAELIV